MNEQNTTETTKTQKNKGAKGAVGADQRKGLHTDEELQALGARPADAPVVEEIKTIDETPSVNAGQPGFEVGDTKFGYYLGTKTVISNKQKKPNWKPVDKKDPDGKVFRLQHKFLDGNGNVFGIWGAGSLDFILPKLRRPSVSQPKGQYVEIKYTGQAEKALKQGQSPPHTFSIKSNEEVELGYDVDEVASLPTGDTEVLN